MRPDRCSGCGRRRAGCGTTHRGRGKCWCCEGLPEPVHRRRRSAEAGTVEPEPPAFPPSPPTVGQRLRVLDLVLTSCARQGIRFEEAWRIAAPVALHGIEDGALAEELRAKLAAEPFRARVADRYERRLRRAASREPQRVA
jgi:hypothetical protein